MHRLIRNIKSVWSYVGKVAKGGLLALGALSLVLSAYTPSVASNVAHSKVVSADPANWTPNIREGAVYKLHQVGNFMIAGGNFKNVAKGKTIYSRSNLVAFDARNGKLSTFAPNFNAPVWAIQSQGNSLYVGGDFTQVNGVAIKGLAKFNLSTGQLDTTFKSPLKWGKVSEMQIVNNRLIVAGTFPEKMLAADLTTGANTGYINLPITGNLGPTAGAIRVYRFSANAAGTKLVAVGNFTSVGGQTRHRAFMLDLGATKATLSPWYYKPLEDKCASAKAINYLKDVDFSPDGSYFVIVSTGFVPLAGRLGLSLCDAAARFNTNVTNPTKPVWINYTGGDTLHSVAISGSAVYVQGHQRWLDNPEGRDKPGPGAKSRPGVGAIHPTTGKALDWNPGKYRGVGGMDTLVTPEGLWIGSDTANVAGEWRMRVAFFPLP